MTHSWALLWLFFPLLFTACSRTEPETVSGQRARILASFLSSEKALTNAERSLAWEVLRDEGERRTVRESAILVLARAKDPEIGEFILPRLPDSIVHVREIDLSEYGIHPYMLGKALLESAPDNPDVFAPLLSHPDERVVAWAVREYGFYRRHDRSLEVLAHYLNDTRSSVRAGAAYGFSQLFHPKAEPLLLQHLADPEPDVRYNLGWAFLNYGKKSAVPALNAAIAREKNVRVKAMLEKARETSASR